MKCDAFERRLQELLDERARPEDDPILRTHAAICARCRDLLGGQELLFRVLRDCRAAHPPEDSAARIGSTPRMLVSPPSRRSPRPRLLLSAVMVALVASWLIGVYSADDERPELARRDAASARSTPGQEWVALDSAASREQSDGPRKEALAVAEPIGAEEYRRLMRELFDRFSQADFDELATVDQITGGFRPLATTLNAAFDALRRTLPGSQSGRPEPSKGDSASLPRRGAIG